MKNDNIKKLLEENRKLNKKIDESVDYIRRYIFYSKIFNIIKIFIIAIPLILSFIYLPSILNSAIDKYSGFLNNFNPAEFFNFNCNEGDSGIYLKDLTEEQLEFIKKTNKESIIK